VDQERAMTVAEIDVPTLTDSNMQMFEFRRSARPVSL
jgi:hypothetical protein